MHRDGPCQSQGKLGVKPQLLFLDLLLFLVKAVADVLPDVAFNVHFIPLLVYDRNDARVVIDAVDDAQSAVDLALLLIVLDKDDLCTGLDFQFHWGWQ